ncbi:MAG: biopolymer transport protein TolR [Candidatus Pseudothioglobus sp.]|jgi:biopolymer transport protein TolR|tara:strand:- start:820 stop:1272 length:453 start_codon:yes stop_codon:yes gene_type:complete
MIELPRRSRPDIHADINIVPYIDVMLVLLVIFMMTTPIIQQGMEVDLPQGPATALDFSDGRQPIVITVDRNNNYYLNSIFDEGTKEVDETQAVDLNFIVNEVYAKQQIWPEIAIILQGDKRAEYGTLFKLMSVLKSNGIDKVSFSSEDPN